MREHREASGTNEQRGRTWPADHLEGFITRTARTFHHNTDCRQYQQALRNNARRFGATTPAPIEWVTAAEARRRGKGVCSSCWLH